MYNAKDILTRLQNGETAETIANELVTALNEANNAFEKEKKAAEEAAKKAAEVAAAATKAKKIAAMQEILDLLYDYCLEFHCTNNEDIDELDKIFESLKAEDVVDMIETYSKLLDSINFSWSEQPKNAVQIKKTSSDADETIANFLKNWNLI